jgi:hypothetical protein
MDKEATQPSKGTADRLLGKLRLPAALCLVGILTLGCYYFFFVQNKYNYLTGRDFRFLATIGTQLESSLQTRSRLLENQIDREALKKAKTVKEKESQLRGNLETSFETVKLVDATPQSASGFEKPRLFLERASHETWVHAYYTLPVDKKKKPLLHSSFKLQSLAEPLFRSRKAFDAVLLADSDGRVVYSQGDRDLSVTSLNLLLDKSNSIKTRFKKESVNPGRFLHGSSESYSVELNGREYRLFVEPVNLPLQGLKSHDSHVPVPDGNTVWLVCGLVPKREFLYKSMATSSALLSTLMGLLLLAALSWPFLKLVLIGESQRVSVFDVLLLGVCTILGISVATLFLLHIGHFGDLKEDSKYQLEAFAGTMENNIRTEIVAAYKTLRALEPEALKKTAQRSEGIQGVNEENLLAQYPAAFKDYPLAQTFMLMNKDGGQVYRGTVNKRATPRFPVNERAYFKRALSGDLWDIHALEEGGAGIPEEPDADHTFYIESVVGWSSGIRLAMISKALDPDKSKKDGDPKVAALSLPMISLVDPVLPPGFKFAVLDSEDENGRVLFHSDSERNLTEDFLVETDRNRRLRSAVLARRAETMEVRYWGEDYMARVAPVRGLPWTIVVLKDMRIPRAVDVSWTSTTLLLLLLYTGVLIVLVAGVLGARPSYRAEWVWPDPQSLPEYRQLIAVYLLLILGSVLAIQTMQGSTQLLGAMFVFPALTLVLTYLKLHKMNPGRGIALVIGLSLLIPLATVLSQAYHETSTSSALLMIAFILAASAVLIAGRPFPTLKELRASQDPQAEGVESTPPRLATEGLDWRSVAFPYRLGGGLLLLLITVLPTMGFFKVSYQLHSVSLLRHGQLKLALEMKKRANRAAKTVDKVASPERECLQSQRLAVPDSPVAPCSLNRALNGLDIYASAFHGTHVELPSMRTAAMCGADCRCTPEDSGPEFLPDFIEDRLPRSSEPAAEMRELLHARASDCSWHWGEEERESSSYVLHSQDYPGGGIHLTSNPRQPLPARPSGGSEKGVHLASMVENLVPSGLAGLLFLGLLGGLVALVILFISKRIFLIDLVEPLWFEKNDEGPATIGRNLFLVGKSRSWQEDDSKFFRLRIVDLEDPEKGWPARRSELLASKGVILVDGFEHRLRDPEFNLKKLALLEELVGLQERTIVVTSAVSPALLFSRERKDDRDAPAAPSPLSVERRWRNLLSLFTIAEDDLQGFLKRAKESSGIQSEVLRAECGFHSHLLPIARDLDRHRLQFSDEQILEEFGERAEGYYQALWASCSSEEQLVIEHLAEERLVNEKNRRVIRRLMARGFIRREPNFKLMNETFRRFVISSSHKAEVLAIEREAAPSAWDRLRTPLFTGLAASIIFFLATQQELLDGLAASLTGVTAGLPAILRLLHVFGGNRPDFSRLMSSK